MSRGDFMKILRIFTTVFLLMNTFDCGAMRGQQQQQGNVPYPYNQQQYQQQAVLSQQEPQQGIFVPNVAQPRSPITESELINNIVDRLLHCALPKENIFLGSVYFDQVVYRANNGNVAQISLKDAAKASLNENLTTHSFSENSDDLLQKVVTTMENLNRETQKVLADVDIYSIKNDPIKKKCTDIFNNDLAAKFARHPKDLSHLLKVRTISIIKTKLEKLEEENGQYKNVLEPISIAMQNLRVETKKEKQKSWIKFFATFKNLGFWVRVIPNVGFLPGGVGYGLYKALQALPNILPQNLSEMLPADSSKMKIIAGGTGFVFMLSSLYFLYNMKSWAPNSKLYRLVSMLDSTLLEGEQYYTLYKKGYEKNGIKNASHITDSLSDKAKNHVLTQLRENNIFNQAELSTGIQVPIGRLCALQNTVVFYEKEFTYFYLAKNHLRSLQRKDKDPLPLTGVSGLYHYLTYLSDQVVSSKQLAETFMDKDNSAYISDKKVRDRVKEIKELCEALIKIIVKQTTFIQKSWALQREPDFLKAIAQEDAGKQKRKKLFGII
jgi:hypothetical protein